MTQELHAAIKRIETMEWCFDTVQCAMKNEPAAMHHSPVFHALVAQLRHYYEGGQWLRDFALDEAKLLPSTLKRGVLSEDGVYDFLIDYDKMLR